MLIAREVAPRLTVDGFFTVDYFTTFVLGFATFSALLMRMWNPFTLRSIHFTNKLWTEGSDEFLEYDKEKRKFQKVTYDLYEWFHLSTQHRERLLFHYCRSLNQADIERIYDEDGIKTTARHDEDDEAQDAPTDWTDCMLKKVHGVCTEVAL